MINLELLANKDEWERITTIELELGLRYRVRLQEDQYRRQQTATNYNNIKKVLEQYKQYQRDKTIYKEENIIPYYYQGEYLWEIKQ